MKTQLAFRLPGRCRTLGPGAVLPHGMAALVLLALPYGCKEEKPEPRPCCDQPEIPAGVVGFKVVADDVQGPSDGERVALKAVLTGGAGRHEVYPVLHTLYRHAMTRSAFEPIVFSADVYPDENAARAGTGAVARIERDRGQRAPSCENRVPYTFQQSAEIAFGVLFRGKAEEDTTDTCKLMDSKDRGAIDEGFKLRASVEIDAEARRVVVTYPFTELGKDEWKKELRYTSAMREWIDYTTAFFDKVPDLAHLTFVGLHADAEVLRIALAKEQFAAGFANLREEIAAHSAVTFQQMGMNAASEKEALADQEDFYRKTYKTALSSLPADQLKIAKTLK